MQLPSSQLMDLTECYESRVKGWCLSRVEYGACLRYSGPANAYNYGMIY